MGLPAAAAAAAAADDAAANGGDAADADGEREEQEEQEEEAEEGEEPHPLHLELARLQGRAHDAKMRPQDAPPGSLRAKLLQHMTCLNTEVKRCVGELVWALCGADAQEFTRRAGLGNGISILQGRGLYPGGGAGDGDGDGDV
jgi:hypothetical protein